jgi:hypothetical protein
MSWATPALAHCDTLDGPVAAAAREALDTGEVELALVWVPQTDEAEIRNAFQRSRNVRSGGDEARSLADAYFFETLVRVHRAGEGAAYSGLKPAGRIEPVVAAADKAIETGSLQSLAGQLTAKVQAGLRHHFAAVSATKRYDPVDVDAGRAFTKAYVEFVHYAEHLHDAAQATALHRGQGAAVGQAH